MRTTATTTAVVATTIGLLALATPAFAVGPGWEPGYAPTCSVGEASWVDSVAPVINGRSTKAYLVQGVTKPTAPRSVGTIRVSDACSGVKDVRLTYRVPGGFGYAPYTTGYTTPVTANWHQANVPMKVAIPWNAYGPLVITATRVRDRMDYFGLNSSNTAVTWYGAGSRTRTSTSQRTVYLLKRTYLPAAIDQSLVPAGSPVAISGTMTNADCDADCGTGFTPGAKVRLQWRVAGTSSWTNLGVTETDEYGHYLFSDSPATSGSYRVVFTGEYAEPWLAPSVSNVVSVTAFL